MTADENGLQWFGWEKKSTHGSPFQDIFLILSSLKSGFHFSRSGRLDMSNVHWHLIYLFLFRCVCWGRMKQEHVRICFERRGLPAMQGQNRETSSEESSHCCLVCIGKKVCVSYFTLFSFPVCIFLLLLLLLLARRSTFAGRNALILNFAEFPTAENWLLLPYGVTRQCSDSSSPSSPASESKANEEQEQVVNARFSGKYPAICIKRPGWQISKGAVLGGKLDLFQSQEASGRFDAKAGNTWNVSTSHEIDYCGSIK